MGNRPKNIKKASSAQLRSLLLLALAVAFTALPGLALATPPIPQEVATDRVQAEALSALSDQVTGLERAIAAPHPDLQAVRNGVALARRDIARLGAPAQAPALATLATRLDSVEQGIKAQLDSIETKVIALGTPAQADQLAEVKTLAEKILEKVSSGRCNDVARQIIEKGVTDGAALSSLKEVLFACYRQADFLQGSKAVASGLGRNGGFAEADGVRVWVNSPDPNSDHALSDEAKAGITVATTVAAAALAWGISYGVGADPQTQGISSSVSGGIALSTTLIAVLLSD